MAEQGRKSTIKFKASKQNWYCCNPFKKHRKFRKGKLVAVNRKMVNSAKSIGISMNTNQQLCNGCRVNMIRRVNMKESKKSKEIQEERKGEHAAVFVESMDIVNEETRESVDSSHSSGGSSTHSEFEAPIDPIDKTKIMENLNALLAQLKMETVNSKKLRSSSFSKAILAELNNKLSNLFGISDERIVEREEMILQLKAKFAETSDQNDRFRILSVLPKSWSAHRIQEEFQTSFHIARIVKGLVEQQGVMCSQSRKIDSRILPAETVDKVKQFFEDDDISRPCAGKREYKSYKENNEKVQKQRRLVLMNLREAYELFCKEHTNVKIGFTKFTMCRPPHCILALESYGTHSTCVCIYHQNATLTCDSLKRSGICPELDGFKSFFNMMLCAEAQRTEKCYMLECQKCPGKSVA